ncbi:MAG: Flp1 family type IVb pilin [Eubacteriales bacterium]|nr:Flp1 family type IVb pilin [Eubacteriales bacterium]
MKKNKKGMEMVQVALLIGIAVALGLVFRERIMDFIDSIFDGLANSGF